MRVLRTISMNPVEPEPMSMRVPAKVPLTIDFQYLDILGKPLTDDLAAQLQVTSRTGDTTDVYAVPATDIVNGKARASIAKDVLTDINGYRLRLVGTYKGEPKLLALGTLRITDAAGIDDTPEDVIDNVPLTIPYNFGYSLDMRLWQDAGKGTPFDLESATITAVITPSRSDPTVLVPFDIIVAGPGHILLQLTVEQVNALPASIWWWLRASNAAGMTTLCEGPVTCIGNVVTP